ncbi:MAG: disulfide bond formation protein B [Chloroflexi bacterium]|nr:disulfide bond formation protein B [Chloroflexota bacterium]|tara:strand:+ start:210 stop:770 length:561 start_codon:yes stop_codon:yes gene_type:complete
MIENLTNILTDFLAISTLIGLIVSIFLIILFFLKKTKKLPSFTETSLLKNITKVSLPSAWFISAISMVTSLYYSEVAGYEACTFCWYERIAMYPLVIILGIASWRDDFKIKIYALPIATLGMLISIYHYQLQLFPNQSAVSCNSSGSSVSCTGTWILEFGFISIPFMAFTGFLLIISLLLLTDRIR